MPTKKGDKRRPLPEQDDDFHNSPPNTEAYDLEEDPSIAQDTKHHAPHTKKTPLRSASTIAKAVALDTLSNRKNLPDSSIVKQALGIAAGYGLFLGAFKSFKAFRKSFRELRQVREIKEPAETYKARVMEKVWECLQHIASFTGYVASIISLIAAVSTPFGLAIAGGTLSIITAIGLGAAFVSALAEKLAEKKIASTRAFLNEVKEVVDQSDFKDHPHAKMLGKMHEKLVKIHDMHDKLRGISKEYREHGHENPALFLIEKAHEHEKLFLKAANRIGGDHYEHIAASTLETLKSFKNDPNPIYHGISFARKMMSEDRQELLIKVPRIKKDAKPADHIRCFKDHQDHVQMHTNANPTDETLCLMMAAVASKLGPLEMKPGGDIKRILRVLEAAKLANVEIIIHPSDRTRIQAADPKFKDYLDALLQVSAKNFQHYVEKEVKKRGVRALGEIPGQIPSNWKSSPKPTKY